VTLPGGKGCLYESPTFAQIEYLCENVVIAFIVKAIEVLRVWCNSPPAVITRDPKSPKSC
jgi:hypothetical protein